MALRHSRIIAHSNLDREATERAKARIASLRKANRFATTVASGAGLTRFVKRGGASAWAEEKAKNSNLMREYQEQRAYSYVKVARKEEE